MCQEMTQVRFLTVIFNISSTFNIVFLPEGAGIGHVLTNHVTTFPDVSLFNQRIKVYFFSYQNLLLKTKAP